MAPRFGTMIPVPESRIEYLNDGDEIDLGDGEKLKAYFTPGHQPSGMVLHARKNNGLFINDLCGMYLADVDISLIFTPDKANVADAMKSLNRIKDIPVDRLFLGHFGICDKPKEVIENALTKMQQLMDIGERCTKEGRPEDIEKEVYARIVGEADKVRASRGEDLYQYLSKELLPNLARGFARYYTEQYNK